MQGRLFKLSVILAIAASFFGLGVLHAPIASAHTSDVCQMTAWDSTGKVLNNGDTVGGTGAIYLLFRVQDDSFGFVSDFLKGPVQDLVNQLQQQISDIDSKIADDQSQIATLQTEIAGLTPGDPQIALDQAQIQSLQDDITKQQKNQAMLQDTLAELQQALKFSITDLVKVDPQTGAATLTSRAEVTGFEWVYPNVGHVLMTAPELLTQYVDHIFPQNFNDPDGHPLNSIRAWLHDVAGVPVPSAVSDAKNVCGGSADDGWGFVDLRCIEAGKFHINVIPDVPNPSSEITNGIIDLACPGQADTATISTLYPSLETQPATAGVAINHGETPVTVTVLDQSGNRIDGANVTLTTDNCTFQPDTNHPANAAASYLSPAGGGQTVTIKSDTDTAGADQSFLADNPLQTQAGTAEAWLDCDGPLNVYGPGGLGHFSPVAGTPGTAHITAIVTRPGSNIVLSSSVNVVGPTSVNGLTLSLSATSLQCGNPVTATAKAVDINGAAVSDGTPIWFTTDTGNGVVGGTLAGGAQGGVPSVGGAASVNIATDSGNPGTHTVIAYVLNGAGGITVQQTAIFNCTVPAPAAPTVAAPATGTGTSAITPPNTGDAGLRASNGSSSFGYLPYFAAGACLLLSLAGVSWRIRPIRRRR